MGLAHAISQADNDLKATGRFHDASLAEAGPEQSGKAIIARQRQDELSNGGFINGHLVGLASVCRQLIELYRVLYTTAQIVRITGDDDQKRKVMIFNGAENDPRQQDGFQPDSRAAALPAVILCSPRTKASSIFFASRLKRLASISEKMRSTSALALFFASSFSVVAMTFVHSTTSLACAMPSLLSRSACCRRSSACVSACWSCALDWASTCFVSMACWACWCSCCSCSNCSVISWCREGRGQPGGAMTDCVKLFEQNDAAGEVDAHDKAHALTLALVDCAREGGGVVVVYASNGSPGYQIAVGPLIAPKGEKSRDGRRTNG